MDHKNVMIEILERASAEGLPEQIGPGDSLEKVAVYAELVDAGLLTGSVLDGDGGRPCNVSGARITLAGRLYLEEAKKERQGKKPLHIARRSTQWILLRVVLPIAVLLGGAWLMKYFSLK